MLHRLIGWALNNPLIVILLALVLGGVGVYSFLHVNVEAYPDPAPAIVEIDTLYPGASAEEVERQVTVPMEVTMAGMPDLKYVRTQSLFGLSFLRLEFEYGYEYEEARQEVINRLASQLQPLPPGVTPQISPESPTGEIYRYTLNSPKNPDGSDIYTLNDLKALQDWVLEREFRRVPRIVDVTSSGGTVKRYEIHPDPERLKQFGITLAQLQTAVQQRQPERRRRLGGPGRRGHERAQRRPVRRRRGPGQSGARHERPRPRGGKGPSRGGKGGPAGRTGVEGDATPAAGDGRGRQASRGGESSASGDPPDRRNVRQQSGHSSGRPRRGRPAGARRSRRRAGRGGRPPDAPRQGHAEQARGAAHGHGNSSGGGRFRQTGLAQGRGQGPVHRAAAQGRGLAAGPQGRGKEGRGAEQPGIRQDAARREHRAVLRPHRADQRHHRHGAGKPVPRHDAGDGDPAHVPEQRPQRRDRGDQHPAGAAVRLLDAVPARQVGQPAVHRGRGLRHHRRFVGHHGREHLPPHQLRRARRACRSRTASCGPAHEVEQPLLFSTLIMVCAFLPLFTMQGPEGQIFGPMADTYAFALGGALVLALLLAPVLCLLLLPQPQAGRGQLPGALAQGQLPAAARPLPALPLADAGRVRRPDRVHRRLRRCRGSAGSSCRSWKRATCGFAAPSRSTSRWSGDAQGVEAGPRDHDAPTPRWRPWSTRSAGPTTAPTPAVTTTPSSSCRCGRRRSGRPWSSRRAGARWSSAPSGRGPRRSWSTR